ncbi:MAG: (d)CMP kinase [Balneolaceae bacterium]|nr:MAG: (d)CMP kinase [Balneolaceae bacterium]
MIIVIDGPAGSGKSSTAKELARRHGIRFLDSGALYRAVTLRWLEKGRPGREEFIELLTDIDIRTEADAENFRIFINGGEVTEKIRSGEIAQHVSRVAAVPEVREFINRYMRDLVKTGVYIADGRDLGSAVFPDADLKFYMDASLDERAGRRYKEMREKGQNVTLDEVRDNLASRDEMDRNRAADPLKQPEDALVIDTTGKSFDEQINEMSEIIQKNSFSKTAITKHLKS